MDPKGCPTLRTLINYIKNLTGYLPQQYLNSKLSYNQLPQFVCALLTSSLKAPPDQVALKKTCGVSEEDG